MEFVFSNLGNCNFIMLKEAKSPARNVKTSVKWITKNQTEAYRIVSFLKGEGLKLISDKDKERLKKLVFIGIPNE